MNAWLGLIIAMLTQTAQTLLDHTPVNVKLAFQEMDLPAQVPGNDSLLFILVSLVLFS